MSIYRKGEANIFVSIISGPIYWHIEHSLGIGDARGPKKFAKPHFLKCTLPIFHQYTVLAQGSIKLFWLFKEIIKDMDEI